MRMAVLMTIKRTVLNNIDDSYNIIVKFKICSNDRKPFLSSAHVLQYSLLLRKFGQTTFYLYILRNS